MTPGVGWCDNVVTHLSQLPSPENFSYENFENIHLSLELVINQRPTDLIADVERKGERYFVYRDDLLSAGVVADAREVRHNINIGCRGRLFAIVTAIINHSAS